MAKDLVMPLKEYGLTDKEIGVYLALLPLGSVKVNEIFKKVNYPRITVNNTLQYLIGKGLVSKILKGKISYYSAVDPKSLPKQIEQKKQLLESIIPQLSSIKNSIGESSTVQMFEGFKGVYSIISDVFSGKNKEVTYFGNYVKSLDILKHLPDYARTMRLENNIHARIVIDPAKEEIFHTAKYKRLTKMKFLRSLQDFPAMIFIYGNKVAMFTVKGELTGMIIKNKEFSQAMKMIFELYWKQAKEAKL